MNLHRVSCSILVFFVCCCTNICSADKIKTKDVIRTLERLLEDIYYPIGKDELSDIELSKESYQISGKKRNVIEAFWKNGFSTINEDSGDVLSLVIFNEVPRKNPLSDSQIRNKFEKIIANLTDNIKKQINIEARYNRNESNNWEIECTFWESKWRYDKELILIESNKYGDILRASFLIPKNMPIKNEIKITKNESLGIFHKHFTVQAEIIREQVQESITSCYPEEDNKRNFVYKYVYAISADIKNRNSDISIFHQCRIDAENGLIIWHQKEMLDKDNRDTIDSSSLMKSYIRSKLLKANKDKRPSVIRELKRSINSHYGNEIDFDKILIDVQNEIDNYESDPKQARKKP